MRCLLPLSLGVSTLLALSGCAVNEIVPNSGSGTGPGSGSGANGSGATAGSTGIGGGTGIGGNTGIGGMGGFVEPGTDPGRVTLHRLNNTEYNNTVRDLLGANSRPADEFPLDGSGAGFDNVADVLTLSRTHLQALHAASDALITDALADATQRARIVSCDLAATGAQCAKDSVTAFAPRAWRRPVAPEELTRHSAAIDAAIAAGDSVEQALSIALQAVLLSPNFLFRVELDPDPTSLTPHPVTPHELASRMSYFLWSSMPDDALMASANAGTLPSSLAGEVSRMLGDPKATEIVSNFAGQWLYLRKVDEVTPEFSVFPGFDADLRAAMKRETELLFADVLFNGIPANQLLTAPYTYVNDRLAAHYGMAPVGTDDFVSVDLSANTERPGGVLSHGSVLTVTSHSARTSPVLRGKWVVNQLRCEVISPPPANVDTALPDEVVTGGTFREQLEQHRAEPVCASCHSLMDPIGFGLENYDAIGAYRAMENGVPIDSSGELDGQAFSGPAELEAIIAGDQRFADCMIQNLYTYALGRTPVTSPEHMDGATLAALSETFRQDYNLQTLIANIVQSQPFVTRRGDPSGAGP